MDRSGDTLPTGYMMRLGSIRRRHTGNVTGVAFSPDGKMLASTSWDGAIRLWNPQSGKPIRSLTGTVDRGSFAAAFSPDGRRIVTTSEDGTARVWRRVRPEWWYGVFWLPQFWAAVLLAPSFAWRLPRDSMMSVGTQCYLIAPSSRRMLR